MTLVPLPAGGFAAALDAHVSWLRLRGLSENTIVQRRQVLRLFRSQIKVDPLAATLTDLERWASSIGALASNTRATYTAHIVSFYRWCVLYDVLTADPTLKLMRPRPPRGIPRPISEEDLAVALAGAPREERLWFLLAGYAGMRACEIAPLERDQILDTAATPVFRLLGKGGKERIVPMGPFLSMELQAYGLPSGGAVFKRLDGKPGRNSAARLSQRANECLHGLGIAATLHQLRHRFGTRFYEASKDLRVTQEVMGHAKPETTALYVAFSAPAAVDAVRRLDEQLGATPATHDAGRQATLF